MWRQLTACVRCLVSTPCRCEVRQLGLGDFLWIVRRKSTPMNIVMDAPVPGTVGGVPAASGAASSAVGTPSPLRVVRFFGYRPPEELQALATGRAGRAGAAIVAAGAAAAPPTSTAATEPTAAAGAAGTTAGKKPRKAPKQPKAPKPPPPPSPGDSEYVTSYIVRAERTYRVRR
jgi:hypothetical protein